MTSGSYKKNIAYNSIYRLVMILTPLITSPFVSRVLGAENIGIYTYCYAYATYFVVCSMLGVQDYGNRSIAKSRDDKQELSQTFWQIYYLQALLTIIATIIYIVTIRTLVMTNPVVRQIMIAYVATGLFSIEWFAFGCEEFRFTSIRSIVVRICIVVSIFAFVKGKEDVNAYTAILIFGNLASTIPIWNLVIKRTILVKPNIKGMLSHLKPNLVLFLPVIATTVYQQIDKLMLGNAALNSEVGYYQNAENIVTLPTFLTTAIVTVMLPYISNLLVKGEDRASSALAGKSLYYVTVLNIAMAFGLYAIADDFIPWFLGAGYERSSTLIKVISPIIVVGGISSVVRYEYLIPREKDKTFTISIILGAIVNVVLNGMLIPSYRADGAAIATVIAYIVVMLFQMFFSNEDLEYGKFFIKILPFIGSGFIMLFAIRMLNSYAGLSGIVASILDILIGIFIYGMGSILIFKLTHDDILITLRKRMGIIKSRNKD